MCELAYEFFFKQNTILDLIEEQQRTDNLQQLPVATELQSSSDGSNSMPNTMATTEKDINTQKEVAFSMLIKFLDTIEVSKFFEVLF